MCRGTSQQVQKLHTIGHGTRGTNVLSKDGAVSATHGAEKSIKASSCFVHKLFHTLYIFTPYAFTPYVFTPYIFTPYVFTPYILTP